MKPCKFTFDDEKVWNGFDHGSTWNGFDNVAVNKETLDQLVAESEAIGDSETADMYREIKPENGLYSLGGGFSTQIVNEDADGTAAVLFEDGTRKEIGRFEPMLSADLTTE